MRIVGRLVLAGCTCLLLMLASVWLEHRRPVTLPPPTGLFAVGRRTFEWRDAKDPRRDLLVWVWYPTDLPSADREYLPPSTREAVTRYRGSINSRFLTHDLAKVRSHAQKNAPISARRPSYPVLLMRGGASAEVWNYSTLAEDLASHGYVVAGIDAPGRTLTVAFPDGRVRVRQPENNPERCLDVAVAEQNQCMSSLLETWTGDMKFVVERLSDPNDPDVAGSFGNRLNIERLGVFGHSFGGAQAAQFCREDPRCKAGIDIDGALFGSVVQDGLTCPFLFLMGGHSGESGPEATRVLSDIESVYARLPLESRMRIEIRGANHFLFSDDSALLKSRILMGGLRMAGLLKIDGRRQLAITAACVRAFFDVYLQGANAAALKDLPRRYPEIRIGE